jgi:hypothetical protein
VYDTVYYPEHAGKHTVKITRHGKAESLPVAASPYGVDVVEGADFEHSGVGQYAFTIQARTKKGEPMTHGGERVEVVVKCNERGSEPVPGVETRDNNDGTYTTTYKLDEPGEYLITILMAGRKIKGTPIKQIVL